MKDLMIDLETMGACPNAVVVQIGVVRFDYESGQVGAPILIDVDAETCEVFGGVKTQDTIDWWAKQGGFRHAAHPISVLHAMQVLNNWVLRDGKPERVWSKGNEFDLAILWHYSLQTGVKLPWDFWAGQNVRTIEMLAWRKGWRPEKGVTHRADEDCLLQVRNVLSAKRALS